MASVLGCSHVVHVHIQSEDKSMQVNAANNRMWLLGSSNYGRFAVDYFPFPFN